VGLIVEVVSKEVKEMVEPVRVEYVTVLTFIEVIIELRRANIVAISICAVAKSFLEKSYDVLMQMI
jgi:hypothetical protein